MNLDYNYAYKKMFESWSDLIGQTPIEFKESIIRDQLSIFQTLRSGFDTSALTLVDIEKNKFLYVDKEIEKISGCSHKIYLEKGPKYILSKATLEHIPKLVSSTLQQKIFFSKLQSNERNRYVFNREFAYKKNNGNPKKWILHQVIKHLINPNGDVFAGNELNRKAGWPQ